MKNICRFADTNFENKQLSPIYGYRNQPLVSLEQALQPILPIINQLDHYIKIAKENCTYPSEHGLTCDESAAIYLYTMERGKNSVYKVLNSTLRSEDRSSVKPWFSFLKLFDVALDKLPSMKKVVWRGIRHDISKQLKDNQIVTWWCINSCSSSVSFIKNFLDQNSTLFLIEARNGKDVSGFTNYPNEDEVLLGPGTQLRVVGNALDHIGGLHVVHLKEANDENDQDLSMTKTSANEKLTTKHIVEQENSRKTDIKTLICYPNGDRYEGIKKRWKKAWSRYIGEWNDDKMSGQGIFMWINGNRYEGNYKDSKMHGHGTFYFLNGEKYVGNWTDNMRNGHGIYS